MLSRIGCSTNILSRMPRYDGKRAFCIEVLAEGCPLLHDNCEMTNSDTWRHTGVASSHLEPQSYLQLLLTVLGLSDMATFLHWEMFSIVACSPLQLRSKWALRTAQELKICPLLRVWLNPQDAPFLRTPFLPCFLLVTVPVVTSARQYIRFSSSAESVRQYESQNDSPAKSGYNLAHFLQRISALPLDVNQEIGLSKTPW
jgi:hypothetical protein